MEAIKQQHHHHHHHHHQWSLNRFTSLSFFVKKAIKLFLVSVSIIFSFSFSSYAMQVIANNIDKSYMFLLCNGILVFIVKNSVKLVKESQQESAYSSHLINEKKTAKKIHNYHPEVVKLSSEENQSIVKEDVHQETEGKQEQENQEALINGAEESNYDQEDGTGLIGIEEWNKKFEDFIIKTKKEIKLGSQQQLIMV